MRILILAVLALAPWTCNALTISVDADLLKMANGTPMPTNGLVLLVASTTDNVFTPPTAGSFVSGDDIIVARFDLSGATNGVLIDIAAGLTPTGNWNAGDPLAIYWFPTLTKNATAPTAGTQYGFFTTNGTPDGSDFWVTPSSSGATIDLRFITTDADSNSHLPGSIAASAGLASFTVAGSTPPPSLAIQLLNGGSIGIHLTGVANANYALQYVSALLNANNNWSTLSNGKADSNGFLDFIDAPPLTTQRFYRSQVLP